MFIKNKEGKVEFINELEVLIKEKEVYWILTSQSDPRWNRAERSIMPIEQVEEPKEVEEWKEVCMKNYEKRPDDLVYNQCCPTNIQAYLELNPEGRLADRMRKLLYSAYTEFFPKYRAIFAEQENKEI